MLYGLRKNELERVPFSLANKTIASIKYDIAWFIPEKFSRAYQNMQ